MQVISDIDRALLLLKALTSSPDEMRVLKIHGVPKSKARPRFGKNGFVYTPKESQAAETALAKELKAHISQPMLGNVALVCLFFRPNKQRIDTDNMLKLVCDAATGVVWIDDSQVTSITGIVELDAQHPRTVFAVAPHATTMRREADDIRPCLQCGEDINLAHLGYKAKYCSTACRTKSRTKYPAGPKPCAHCSKIFEGENTRQLMCSKACRIASLKGKRKAAAKPKSNCQHCGKGLAHTRGGSCRECWRAGADKQQGLDLPTSTGAPF